MGFGSTPTGNLLLDDVTGTTIPATDSTGPSTLGFYALGHGTDPTLISSSPVVTPQFNSHLGTGNKDTAGTCTLASNGGFAACSVTFTTPYTHAPVCTANSTGSTNALKVMTLAGSVTITSSSATDRSVVNYICIGKPN
jgi:hypothetical protein